MKVCWRPLNPFSLPLAFFSIECTFSSQEKGRRLLSLCALNSLTSLLSLLPTLLVHPIPSPTNPPKKNPPTRQQCAFPPPPPLPKREIPERPLPPNPQLHSPTQNTISNKNDPTSQSSGDGKWKEKCIVLRNGARILWVVDGP